MCRLGRIYNFPSVLFKHDTLIIWQAALWIVENKPRPQRRKGRVNVNGVGVAREIHCMNAMIREMSAQPFDAF